MQLSTQGLNLIKQSEGFRDHVYKDVAGIQTIGYGHALKHGESFPDGITEDQATSLLLEDVSYAEHAVNTLVKVPLTQGQFDALADFTYNLGAATLQRSTLLKLLNAGKYEEAAGQFMAWDHASGVEIDGLMKRREAEQRIFVGVM